MTFARTSSRFDCGEPVRKRGEAVRKSGSNRRLLAEKPPIPAK